MLVPILLPDPTSSACSPLCRNTPTCHVVVWVHVHEVAHSGTRPTATECGCGVPTELRVQTTVPRTHHSVPHSCLAFSHDRSPAGILLSIRPIDPAPLFRIDLASRDSSKRLLARRRHDASKTRNSKITAIAQSSRAR